MVAAPARFRTHLLTRTPSLLRDILIAFLALLSILAIALPAHADTELLNVSYDPTRELCAAMNAAFIAAVQGERAAPSSRSSSRTAARARRPARSSTASRPTS